MDLLGTITSYSVSDAVGRILLDDGRELRFGATALRDIVPALGLRVRVASTAPHPLGGLRALEIIQAASAEEYQDKQKEFWAAASVERNEKAKQAERDRRPLGEGVKPEPLTPEERALLDEHRRLREGDDRARHLSMVRDAELRREAARSLSTQAGADAFAEVLHRSGIASADARRLIARGRPAAQIVGSVSATNVPLGESKLGGRPDLPANAAWPAFKGKPLAFLGQLRLPHVPTVVRSSLALPDEGLLSFFFEADEQPWGYDPAHRGSARVLLTREMSSLARRAFPPALDTDARFRELLVDFAETFLPAAPYSVHLDDLGLDEDIVAAYREAFAASTDAVDGPAHFLGGRPMPIQDPMEVECALARRGGYMGGDRPSELSDVDTAAITATAGRLRLLLQLDTDDLLGASWGDGGRLYFLVPEEAIAAGQFDDVWCILQCY